MTAQREEFAQLLAHDLRTPLVASDRLLAGFLQGNLGPMTNQQLEFLTKLKSGNQQALLMINNLLALYRLEAGQRLHLTEVSTESIINACLDEMSMLAAEKDLRLSVDLSEQANVWCDSLSLYRVIANLLMNAIKFTAPGGKIAIGTFHALDDNVSISITDTGCGISEEQLELIFERVCRPQSGSGLGLYLSRRLVQLQHGAISCRSAVGRGSTFVVMLPDAASSL